MTEAATTDKTIADDPNAASENPAVERCTRVWQRVYKSHFAKTDNKYSAAADAGVAYRKAMPTLYGFESIRDFIACTAYGILIGAIEGDVGSKLLYAAQVATTTYRQQPAQQKHTV